MSDDARGCSRTCILVADDDALNIVAGGEGWLLVGGFNEDGTWGGFARSTSGRPAPGPATPHTPAGERRANKLARKSHPPRTRELGFHPSLHHQHDFEYEFYCFLLLRISITSFWIGLKSYHPEWSYLLHDPFKDKSRQECWTSASASIHLCKIIRRRYQNGGHLSRCWCTLCL